jgi:hypothetical protein
MKLTAQQRKELENALLSAFPERSEIERLVQYALNENLANIVGNGNLRTVVFELITWCISKGTLPLLLNGAKEENPDNTELKVFFSDLEKTIDTSTDIKKPNNHNLKPTPKIYFSYAWGDNKEQGESRETIVDNLYQSLITDNYTVIRDKMDLGYRGFISDFMKEIGEGDLIVIATSDKYFRSPYCLYELYEIARNCKFDKHIFANKSLPIMVEFIDFSKPKIIKTYIDHWKSELNDWEELIKEDPGALGGNQLDRFNKTKLIQQNFGQLSDWLIDMNTLNPKLLSADNFAEIKNVIMNYKTENEK